MRVLLDNNVHVRFRRLLSGHEITHVLDVGWDQIRNGDLIREAEQAGYDVMITGDKNMRYQQNLATRRISIVVLNSLFLKWAYIAPLAPQVQAILDGGLPPGSFIEIDPSDAR